uniref:Uncharacterized protein n=1 Tax=Oryza glumipatula TaxID=40148 RepID=A0A0E0BUY3_9ORYZ
MEVSTRRKGEGGTIVYVRGQSPSCCHLDLERRRAEGIKKMVVARSRGSHMSEEKQMKQKPQLPSSLPSTMRRVPFAHKDAICHVSIVASCIVRVFVIGLAEDMSLSWIYITSPSGGFLQPPPRCMYLQHILSTATKTSLQDGTPPT